MKIQNIPFFLILILITGLFEGCYYDNLTELHPELGINSASCDSSGTISYSKQIKPILDRTCGTSNSCHGPSNTSSLPLNTYNGVKTIAKNGSFWGSVNWSAGFAAMPKNSSTKLDACSLTTIRKWIDAGALDN